MKWEWDGLGVLRRRERGENQNIAWSLEVNAILHKGPMYTELAQNEIHYTGQFSVARENAVDPIIEEVRGRGTK